MSHTEDPTNDQRAEWAATAINAFGTETGQLEEGSPLPELSRKDSDYWQETLTDLLTAAHHLADRVGLRFDAITESAEGHYEHDLHDEEVDDTDE